VAAYAGASTRLRFQEGVMPEKNTSKISNCTSHAFHRRMTERVSSYVRSLARSVARGGEVGRAGTGNSYTATTPQTSRSHSSSQEILAPAILVVHDRKVDHRGHAGGHRAFLHVPGMGRDGRAPSIGSIRPRRARTVF
jgi:hypothetical protein